MAELCTQCGLPLAAGVGARRVRSGAGHFCCYGCLLTYQITQERGEEGKAQGVLIRLGLGIFFAMNVMLFSLPTYSSYIYNLELTGIDEANFIFFLRIALVVLSLPVLVLLGLPILLNSIREISRLTFSVDTLIALGTFSAYAVSIHNTFARAAHVYFDTASMLLVLVTLGRYLEARAKVKTSESLTHALRSEPATCTLVTREGETTIEPPEIRVGDVLKILPGATIPVDGVVENGSGGVDESSLTGEREPVFKEPGSRVVSGSTSIDGTFLVRAERVESESTLARIAQLLEQAKRSRAGIQRTADRIASFFIPAVALFALAAFVYWSGRVDVETGLMVALSVLVVSCPCALGIATPIAIWMAFAQSARRGVLLRDGETLEALAKVQSLFFDKTGTLTSGELSLSEVALHPDAELSRDALLARVAALAGNSSHPIAKGVLASIAPGSFGELHTSDFRTYPGLGIAGKINGDGDGNGMLYLGSPGFMEREHQKTDPYFETLLDRANARGETTVLAAQDARVVAALTFKESFRPEAVSVLLQLQRLGLDVAILTGDSKPLSEVARKRLKGIGYYNGLLPEQKVERVVAARELGRFTAMVGDGINDAPALAAAHVGMAVATGTDLAREAASVNIVGHDLQQLPWLICYARRVVRKIKQNLFWAFFYNVVAIGFAVTGLLNPLVAALAMILSSLFVVSNSRRLGKP